MVETNWSVQTLSDVFWRYHRTPIVPGVEFPSSNFNLYQTKAEGEWSGAVAAMENLLLQITKDGDPTDPYQGVLLSGPAPVVSHQLLLSHFLTGVFTTESFAKLSLNHFQLPGTSTKAPELILELSLLPKDPIAEERFCLLLTPRFSLIILLGQDLHGLPSFNFSFEPELVGQIWNTLRSRLVLTNFPDLVSLDKAVNTYQFPTPDYKIVSEFTRLLLNHLPLQESVNPSPPAGSKELELLQALTHEIRTPLTSIRTWTKLLLKRRNLPTEVIKRLEMIDQECSEQINRMELIFRATELQSQSLTQPVPLTSIALDQFFQQNIPSWQKQTQRRHITLEVVMPPHLPTVETDPAMLRQVLTGLIEKYTRNLKEGGQIELKVSTAGDQLKLQFLSSRTISRNPIKSLGQVLMFQPETGGLSLNMDVTKNFFQLMGGKFIVRQQPSEGEVLTIFLPLK